MCLCLRLHSDFSLVLLLEWIRFFSITSHIYKTTAQITRILIYHTTRAIAPHTPNCPPQQNSWGPNEGKFTRYNRLPRRPLPTFCDYEPYSTQLNSVNFIFLKNYKKIDTHLIKKIQKNSQNKLILTLVACITKIFKYKETNTNHLWLFHGSNLILLVLTIRIITKTNTNLPNLHNQIKKPINVLNSLIL
jgi:hypothetical protein